MEIKESHCVKRVHTHVLRSRMILDHALLHFQKCEGVSDENRQIHHLFERAKTLQKEMLELERAVMQEVERCWERERVGV